MGEENESESFAYTITEEINYRRAQNRWHYSQAVVMAPADSPLGVVPVEKGELGTETEAEKHLKRMLDKQLDTKLTMKEHFDKHRQFATSSTYKPIAELMSGAHSLKEFSKTEKDEEMYEELQRSGFTEEEIALYIAYKAGKEPSKKIEPSILKAKIKLIEDKLKNRQENLCKPQVFTGVKTLSRHEMDIEKSLYAGCGSRNEFSSLLVNNALSPDVDNCDDPFTHIKNLSETLMKRCKKRKRKNSENNNRCKILKDASQNCIERDSANTFQFDPSIHHVVVPLDDEEVEERRLTLTEIRELPRFSNYSPGIPNKVLYLKNLHRKVTVEELVALFGGFELDNEEPINYTLLTGKMKGQAFVTFADAEIAENALNKVNGYLLRGRAVIIEFGRKG